MPSNRMSTRQHRIATGFVLKVAGWRSVCMFYSLFCVLALHEGSEGAKARCGRELVADLEFVCGDRGFYRGKPGPRSGGPRSRGSGIVEQCCVRGCDLQHLESYCAKPKRGRRHSPAPLQLTAEGQFWQVFQRRYQKHAGIYREDTHQRLRERMLFQWNSRSLELLNSDTKTPNQPPSAYQKQITDQNTSIPTFIPQNRHS